MVHIEEIRDDGKQQRNRKVSSPLDYVETPYSTRINEGIFEDFNIEDPSPLPLYSQDRRVKKITRNEWITYVTVSGVVGLIAILAFAPVENLNKPNFLKRILRRAVVPYQGLFKWGLFGLMATLMLI
jgi:hypothetical protein